MSAPSPSQSYVSQWSDLDYARSMATYAQTFRRTRLLSTDLQHPQTLAAYEAQGFAWIRPVRRSYDQTLRNPIFGGVVELSILPDAGFYLLKSPEARRLIRRICWPF